MTHSNHQHEDGLNESLSEREFEILALLAEGLPDREIAEKIMLAYSTVKWYNHQIYDKLGVTNRREAVKRARMLGLFGTTDFENRGFGKHNLPTQTTPFIGREAELRDVAEMLNDPTVRLITILAPGGMGKTRLALEISAQQMTHFADGVYFVPLAQLSSWTDVIATIASSIGFAFYGVDDPKEQLLTYLSNLSMLLVLDNFEHLLEGAPHISEIIETAPSVRVLVTSREKLSLIGESVYALSGMSFPDRETVDDPLDYDAVELFVKSARRLLRDFVPTAEELSYLTRISQLTQGMPLGIILAAAWIDVLPLLDMVNEISRSLELLQHDLRDIPPRHRSIRAVFDPTWQRLTNEQQAVFMKLCMFRGGFTRDAAQVVAHAGLLMLHTFIDKSLIQADANGRYTIHELLRQYGESHLASYGAVDVVHAAHSAFFMNFLAEREVDIKGYRQLAALREINADFENIRRAWVWAVEHRHDAAILGAVGGLMTFAGMTNRSLDVWEILQHTSVVLAPSAGDPPLPLWDQIALRRELINTSLTRAIDCGLVESILERARVRGDKREMAQCWAALAHCAQLRGEHTTALRLYEDCLVQWHTLADEFSVADTLVSAGNIYDLLGDHERCIAYFSESISIRRRLGDQIGQIFPLTLLALSTVQITGDAETATQYLDEADAIHSEVGLVPSLVYLFGTRAYLAFWRGGFDQTVHDAQVGLEVDQGRNWVGGRSFCLSVMSLALSVREDYLEAQKLCEEALMPGLIEFLTGWPYYGLALASCGLGDFDRVSQSLLNALRSRLFDTSLPDTLTCLPILALWFAESGNPQRAVELLGLAFWYPVHLNGWMHKWPLLTNLRARLEDTLGAETYAVIWERGSARDLRTVWSEIVAELEAEHERRRMS